MKNLFIFSAKIKINGINSDPIDIISGSHCWIDRFWTAFLDFPNFSLDAEKSMKKTTKFIYLSRDVF